MAATFQGFRSLIENSPDAISLIDSQGEILYGSPSNKMFGYNPDDLVGRNCLDLIHPEDRSHSSRALEEVLARPPGPLQWDARIRHKDGNYSWVESTVSNLLLELEVQAMVVHQRDIEARKAAEAKSREQAEQLTRSNQRLEEFANAAAHDLREPLRAISQFTQMLAQKTQMDPNTQQMANFIIDGATRMATLVEDLLSFAKTGMREPPQRVDLQHTVEQAMWNLTSEIEASGAIVTVDRLPLVRGNPSHLVSLFQNLISNAVKYRDERSPEIHVTAERRGSNWIVRVKDNGIGVAPENHARIFVPFVRLGYRDVPGSGLGLAVCKRIVEETADTIWIESEPGIGSTFCFTIAAANDKLALRDVVSKDAVNQARS